MIWHTSSSEQVLSELKSDSERGLSSGEVSRRIIKYGTNRFDERRRESFPNLVMSHIKEPVTVILLIAALVYFIMGLIAPESGLSGVSVAEPIVILFIVVLNALCGALQKTRAQAAVASLELISPPSARVLRNGRETAVPSTNIVPGDIMLLSKGCYIPADGRVIAADGLRCSESVITGVTVDADKFSGSLGEDILSAADQKNMVFSGCTVTAGTGKAVVVNTGKFTELSKISIVSGKPHSASVLQKRLKELGGILGVFAFVICAVILVFGTLFGKEEGGIFSNFISTLLPAAALAVAAVPEGLNTIVAVVMAIGVKRMVKCNVVVRSPSVVEALGGTTVVCTDKTGILTHNSMELTHIFYKDEVLRISGDNADERIKNVIMMASMCCDATAENIGGKIIRQGDGTEAAIVAAAEKYAGGDKHTVENIYPRLCEIPFDPVRRLMTSVNMIDSKPVAVVKGGVDEVLCCCSSADTDGISKAYEQMAKMGLRVIAVAYKTLDAEPTNPTPEDFESGLYFGGLLGIYDPPRRGAESAVKVCGDAGIKVVMFTGDHPATAGATALEMGIITSPEQIMTGEQMDALSDDDFKAQAGKYRVFASVSPAQKKRVVTALKDLGEVVTVLSDGVSDAPVIEAADIGCTVESAPDAAKGVADVILTNNSFSAMSDAVTESRGIFSNIRRAIRYLIACNLGEVLTLLFAIIIWRELPLSAMHILFINMITSAIPAVSVGAAVPNKANIQPISDKNGGDIFTKANIARIIYAGVLTAVLTLVAFSLGGREKNIDLSTTMAFATLSLSQLFVMVSVRSNRMIIDFKSHRFSPLFLLTFFGSLALIGAVLFVPAIGSVFGFVSLIEYRKLGQVILISLIPLVIFELLKIPEALKRGARR